MTLSPTAPLASEQMPLLRKCSSIIIATVIFVGFTSVNAYSDSIEIKNKSGKIEEYYGKILSANHNEVEFLIECSGQKKVLKWNSLNQIRINSTCKPGPELAYGGFEDLECNKRFMIIDNHYESEFYEDTFSYTPNILSFGTGGNYNIAKRTMRDEIGAVSQLSQKNHSLRTKQKKSYATQLGFTVAILPMSRWCKKKQF